MKSLKPAKLWGTKDFFSGVGYYTHNLEGDITTPESVVVPLRPPPSISGSFSVAPILGHHPQSQAHSRLSECDSRPPVLAKLGNNDREKSPSRDHNPNLCDMGISNSGHVCHSPQCPSSPVYISDFRASSTGDRCSVTRLAGTVDIHTSTVCLAQQSHSETTCHPERQDNSNSPWWPSQLWFPHLIRLCEDHPRIIPYRCDLLLQQGFISDGKSYCTHGGSHAALPSSRIFRSCL